MSTIFLCKWPGCDFEGRDVEIIKHITSKHAHLGIISEEKADTTSCSRPETTVCSTYSKNGDLNYVCVVPRANNERLIQLQLEISRLDAENTDLCGYIEKLEETLRQKDKEIRELRDQKRKERTLDMFMCSVCGLTYWTNERLHKHMIEEHWPKETCPYPDCTVSFPKEKFHRMHDHINRRHTVLQQEDNICKRTENDKLNPANYEEKIEIPKERLDVPDLEDISDTNFSDESETDFDDIDDPQIDLE